jgi:hypothetical protein
MPAGPKFDYLVMILMENHSFSDIYNQATYLTGLANDNALLEGYSGVDHPSEPNYLAIAAGKTFAPLSRDDNYHMFNAANIVDSLEAAGKTWKVYTEAYSGSCDMSDVDIRHVPFIFFTSVSSSAARCANVVSATPGTDAELVAELNSATPSNFIWLTPNDTNNMHSAPVSVGDAYLQALVPKILGSTTFTTKKAALFIVFDEGSGNTSYPNDLIYAVWAGSGVKKQFKSMTSYSHYSVMATLEANWGLASLGANDVGAPSMLEVFQ